MMIWLKQITIYTFQASPSVANPQRSRRSSEPDDFNWAWLEEEWPLSDRPRVLQDPAQVARRTIAELTAMHKNYLLKKKNEEKEKARAKGAGKVAKDTQPEIVIFPEAEDDCKTMLHAARWQRTPIVHPEKWFGQTPTTRDQIFKAVPLKFHGADGCVANKTLERAHDRTDALLLKHFLRKVAKTS